jgi:hypothetical protein
LAAAANSSSRDSGVARLSCRVYHGFPIPGRKLVDPVVGIVGRGGEDEGQPGSRADVIEDVIELAGVRRPSNCAEWFGAARRFGGLAKRRAKFVSASFSVVRPSAAQAKDGKGPRRKGEKAGHDPRILARRCVGAPTVFGWAPIAVRHFAACCCSTEILWS